MLNAIEFEKKKECFDLELKYLLRPYSKITSIVTPADD